MALASVSLPLKGSWQKENRYLPLYLGEPLSYTLRPAPGCPTLSPLLKINQSSPGPEFGIGRFIRLLGIMQRRLDILVAQPLADRCQADPSIDQFGGVGVA